MAAGDGKQSKRKTVKGVRVACIGEVKCGMTPLADYDLPSDHDVFSMGELCPISELLGVPFLVSRVRPSLRFAATKNSFSYDLDSAYHPNETIEALMICCDARLTGDSNGGLALLETPKRWSQMVGSVVVARKDRKPRHAHHVQVLLKFISTISKLGGHDKADSAGVSGDEAAVEEVVAQFTPGEFKEFYQIEKCHWKQEHDFVHLLGLPSPWSEREAMGSDRDKMATTRMHNSKKTLEREKYILMTFDEKLQDTQTWREHYLLTVIARLKARLGEGPESLTICCPNAREKLRGEDDRHPLYTSWYLG